MLIALFGKGEKSANPASKQAFAVIMIER